MAGWIRFASWALILFSAPGLLFALVTSDWGGVLINGALLAIAILDLRNLALAKTDPVRGWGAMVWTQLALGVVVGVSFALLGQSMADSDIWDMMRQIINEMIGSVPDREWNAKVAQIRGILKWGTLIGGIAIFLGQLQVCWKIRRRAEAPAPPPLTDDIAG